MEILVNRGVVIEADTIEEALEKTKPTEGVTVAINANPRPQPVPQGIQTSGQFSRTTAAQIPAKP